MYFMPVSLLQWLDSGAIRFRCMLTRTRDTLSCLFFIIYRKLRFYGPSLQRDQLEPLLVWATPGQRGFPTRDGQSAVADSGQGNRRQTQATSAKQQEAQQKALELKDMLN